MSTSVEDPGIAAQLGSCSVGKNQLSADIKRGDKFVGNVSNYAPLPADFKGPLTKGNLVFNACFEAGEIVVLMQNC